MKDATVCDRCKKVCNADHMDVSLLTHGKLAYYAMEGEEATEVAPGVMAMSNETYELCVQCYQNFLSWLKEFTI